MNDKIFSELLEIKKLLKANKEVLTVDELVDYAGLSKSYIYHLTCDRQIPFYKSQGGGRTYFKRSEIDAWLLAARYDTVSESEAKAAKSF